MVSFQSIALLLVIALCEATESSFRSTSMRRLSFEKIAGYEPNSQVTDHAAIDLDQDRMETQLALATSDSYTAAKSIYEEGGHSKSFAEVTVTGGTAGFIPKGTEFVGQTEDGQEVRGKALADFDAGAPVVRIQYNTNPIQASYVDCQVGGLVPAKEENLNGCFADSGSMVVSGVGSITYQYDKTLDNNNDRTLAGFSLQAQAKMYECGPQCPYPDYEKFYKYYGQYDYGNQWVQAAFTGTSTSFTNGNADFGSYGFDGRTEAIKKGTAYLNVFMYVIREMEDALDDCQEGCTLANCNDDPVHAWDEAVAFYAGSLEGKDGSGSGKLLHELADKRCANFKTCGVSGDETEGLSKVNRDIFREFKLGQSNLLAGKCAETRKQKDRIAQLMYVPMVQGTLRYAYITQNDSTSGEKAESEGATFAAAVLPVVHACNPGDAQTIYDNMRVGFGDADFSQVKSAFERNYGCMGISCEDVGGLYDDANEGYLSGASPCGGSGSGSSNNTVGIAVGVSIGAIVVLGVGFLLLRRRRRSDVDKNFSTSKPGVEQVA